MLMVEVAPGHFVNEFHARIHYGVWPRKGGRHGKAKD